MYLGAYHFDGEPGDLLRGYARLMEGRPSDTIDLHVCVVRVGGITVYDACPSRAVFEEFSESAGFRAAVAAAGLPALRVEPVGEVHSALCGQGLGR